MSERFRHSGAGAIQRLIGSDVSLALLGVVLLLPFINKAFHIDDPVFLAQGRHLLEHPDDPLGFAMNWDGEPALAAKFHTNPPLVGYYLALGIGLFGEKEIPLHAMFLVFPFLAALSLASLARRLGTDARMAGLMLLCAPCFLVNATNLMADVPVLSFLILAVRTHCSKEGGRWWLSGAFATLAVMTKYSGMLAVPIFFLYEMTHDRKWWRALAASVLPVLVVGTWCLFTQVKYGQAHPLSASAYLATGGRYVLAKFLASLSFLGGTCAFPVVLLAWTGWRRLVATSAVAWGIGSAIAAGLIRFFGWSEAYGTGDLLFLGFLSGHAGVFLIRTIGRTRTGSGDIRFLSLWILLTFVFNLLMECMAAKFLLLLWPPALLFLVLEAQPTDSRRKRLLAASAAMALVFSLLLAWNDWEWANWYRKVGSGAFANAESVEERLREIGLVEDIEGRGGGNRQVSEPGQSRSDADGSGLSDVHRREALPRFSGKSLSLAPFRSGTHEPEILRLRILGHWGFQYYLERAGGVSVNLAETGESAAQQGPWLAAETAWTHPVSLFDMVDGHGKCFFTPRTWGLRLMNESARAGFYCHSWGLLPWSLSNAPMETFWLWPPSARLRPRLNSQWD